MGQRHQAFLIVRLTPTSSEGQQPRSYYRCVSALHHQSCYGHLPVAATRRFLNLLKNPENAAIVRDEIHRAHGRYGRQGDEPDVPESAFPYTKFLLVQAFNMDIDNPFGAYASGVGFEDSFLNPNIGWFGYDNHNGVTVIDISDPLNPAYCHSKGRGRVLDADEYIGEYRQVFIGDTVLEVVQGYIASLKDERVITADVLSQVWPQSFYPHYPHPKEEPASTTQPAEECSTTTIPPLADIALKQVIEHCISNDTFEPLETLADMPGKIESISVALFSQGPLPDSAGIIMDRVLQYELQNNGGLVDLSSARCTFTANVIRTVVTRLPSDAVKAIDLTGSQTITIEVIIDILTIFPSLIRLTLLDTNVTDEQVVDLLYTWPKLFYHIQDFIHPTLLVHRPPPSAALPDDDDRHNRMYPSRLSCFVPALPKLKALPDDPEELHALHQQVFSGPESFTVMFTGGNLPTSGLGPAVASIPFFYPEKVLRGLIKCLDRPRWLSLSQRLSSHGLQFLQRSPKIRRIDCVGLHRSIGNVPIGGTYDRFLAHGWLFVLDYSSRKDKAWYGFIRIDEEARRASLLDAVEAARRAQKEKKEDTMISGDKEKDNKQTKYELESAVERRLAALALDAMKVYDIRGFADAVEKEGRPRPSEDVMAAFEEIIGGNKYPIPEQTSPPYPFRVMELGEAQVLFRVLIGEVNLFHADRM
ncbi:hypothetical protein VNI00_013575 [Paramarasmius palmivorus]|uniref:Uncharacterized protein n=1 Tax=Paramarasmius palmivorus TaxID=297713 RepID=A0AAW0BWC1_9AGAR